MSGKVKMRCGRCGKSFKPSGAKQVFCPECAAKERAARQAQKNTPTAGAAAPSVAAPKIVGPGANILVPGATPPIVTADAPPDTGLFGAAARVSERTPDRAAHGGQEARTGQGAHGSAEQAQSPAPSVARPGEHAGNPRVGNARPPKHGGEAGHGNKHTHGAHSKTAEAAQARPPREPRPAPFMLTDEMRQRIEARYLELAHPIEFDGIRTQIAQELSVPKGAVKRVVSELRGRMQLPSWWELQAYHGSEADLERIRATYTPLLPIPPVGVHKQISEQLSLDPITVYQGIRRIRAEMRLPQYNPPEAHADAPDQPGQELERSVATTSSASGTAATSNASVGTPPSNG